MAWDDEALREIVSHCGPVGALWLLAIIEKQVGTSKAHNYSVFPGKIKSIAKEIGAPLPDGQEIGAAFKKLRRTKLQDPDGGVDNIILGDKEEYVKLTDHGKTLVTAIDSDVELERHVMKVAGAEIGEDEPEEWWPDPVPANAPVQLTTTDRPESGASEWEMEVVAAFPCPEPTCEGMVEHRYSLRYPNEAWTKKVVGECGGCGQEWEHLGGDPWDEPVAAGR